jgi:hypothetical protein
MILKIPVEDRISTYPGRVTLTPVEGEVNKYDMVRADEATTEGTPINKALFDSKAYTLTKDVVLYVSPGGSDSEGDGNSDAPYKTIQAAIDSLPKHLGGHTAQIDIAAGTYDESLLIEGFSSGKLAIGVGYKDITVSEIKIVSSSFVELRISDIKKSANFSGNSLYITDGSDVLMVSDLTIDCAKHNEEAVEVSNGSTLSSVINHVLTINNCYNSAVVAGYASHIALGTVTGENNSMGLFAMIGGIVSFKEHTLDGAWGDHAQSGGLLITSGAMSTLSPATLE